MNTLFFIGLVLFLFIVTWLWASGIDKMKKDHPDYKGEDFLNENEKNGSGSN
jgi:hypothetical protein